jgi:hypothetical protein
LYEPIKPSTVKKLLSLSSIRRQSLLKGRCSLPSQRTNGADVRGDTGNPKGTPYPRGQGPRCFDPFTARSSPGWCIRNCRAGGNSQFQTNDFSTAKIRQIGQFDGFFPLFPLSSRPYSVTPTQDAEKMQSGAAGGKAPSARRDFSPRPGPPKISQASFFFPPGKPRTAGRTAEDIP